MGGVQGGFDYQFAPNWVLGAEAQYSWLGGGNNNGVLFPAGTLVTGSNNNQLGSVTGRLGYTWGPALLYGKGGYAWRDSNNIGVTIAGVPQPFTTTGNRKDGYTVGAGLEYMFAPNWSAKAEYQYYNFGSTTFTAGPPDIVGARLPRRRAHRQGRPELPLRLGRSGRRQVLIKYGSCRFRTRQREKAGLAPAFLFRNSV